MVSAILSIRKAHKEMAPGDFYALGIAVHEILAKEAEEKTLDARPLALHRWSEEEISILNEVSQSKNGVSLIEESCKRLRRTPEQIQSKLKNMRKI